MKEKRIPRAIRVSLLDKLKLINPDINKAIESLMSVNLREIEPAIKKEPEIKELSKKIWNYLKYDVQSMIDQSIEDAKRGY